ncbi:hypothetical protein [Mucilaginibacter sp.]|uniref:hypothetical protein n=1 Tax=Mucilaginibacter sp. TaxID=1882438 RepID=UPI003B0003D1
MADVRLSINQSFMDDLSSKTGVEVPSQLTADALTLFNWAVSEAKKGRILVSVDQDGQNPVKYITPTLERLKQTA